MVDLNNPRINFKNNPKGIQWEILTLTQTVLSRLQLHANLRMAQQCLWTHIIQEFTTQLIETAMLIESSRQRRKQSQLIHIKQL